MTLAVSITDYIPSTDARDLELIRPNSSGLRAIVKTIIVSDGSEAIPKGRMRKPSEQCAKYEALAVKIKELVDAFYGNDVAEAE